MPKVWTRLRFLTTVKRFFFYSLHFSGRCYKLCTWHWHHATWYCYADTIVFYWPTYDITDSWLINQTCHWKPLVFKKNLHSISSPNSCLLTQKSYRGYSCKYFWKALFYYYGVKVKLDEGGKHEKNRFEIWFWLASYFLSGLKIKLALSPNQLPWLEDSLKSFRSNVVVQG